MKTDVKTATTPTILTMLHSYWPGNAATGPVRSLAAMMEMLAERFAFRLLAQRKANVGAAPAAHQWHPLGHGEARYLDAGVAGAQGLGELLRETQSDLIYLNGFFDRILTIPTLIMRHHRRIPRRPLLIAPRGEFAPAALAQSPVRKKAYLAFGRSAGLFADIWLHATAQHEVEDLLRAGYSGSRILLAPDTRTLPRRPAVTAPSRDADAPLRLAFVGRLTPMKNIDFALQVLSRIGCAVEFDLFGPVADPAYWSQCEEMARRLPQHVRVTAKGLLAHDEVAGVLAGYDLFFLPSRGENFGHAIFEALAAGLPVLTSNRTPWTDLEVRGCGWSLPLDDPERFAGAIDAFAALGTDARTGMRRAARQRAEQDFAASDVVVKTVAMFDRVIAEGRRER